MANNTAQPAPPAPLLCARGLGIVLGALRASTGALLSLDFFSRSCLSLVLGALRASAGALLSLDFIGRGCLSLVLGAQRASTLLGCLSRLGTMQITNAPSHPLRKGGGREGGGGSHAYESR